MFTSIHYGHHRSICVLAHTKAGLLPKSTRVGIIDIIPGKTFKILSAGDLEHIYDCDRLVVENSTNGVAWYRLTGYNGVDQISRNFEVTKIFQGKWSDVNGITLRQGGDSNQTLLKNMYDLGHQLTAGDFIKNFAEGQ